MSHRKTIYGSLHCLAAVIDGKHVQDAIAHPCYVSGKKTFSVIFYYFDGHANYVRFSFTNKSIRRCVCEISTWRIHVWLARRGQLWKR